MSSLRSGVFPAGASHTTSVTTTGRSLDNLGLPHPTARHLTLIGGIIAASLLACIARPAGTSTASFPKHCEHAPSPNFNDRPKDSTRADGSPVEIDTVVLHATERGALWQVKKVFATPEYAVSAHLTIGKRGEIICHVPFEKRAWHAGVSRMPDGRNDVNDFSIGIELLNRNNGIDSYPDAQKAHLRAVLHEICEVFDIKFVVSHRAIALPQGRKSDPVGLDSVEVAQACSEALLIW